MIQNGKLEIFENFRTDRTLPKFRKPPAAKKSTGEYQDAALAEALLGDSDTMQMAVTWAAGASRSTNFRLEPYHRTTWLSRIKGLFKRKEPKPSITIEQFFRSVKDSVENLEVVKERSAGYEAALLRAKQGGQTALFEQLTDNLVAVRAETQLIAMGLTKFLTEEPLIEFVKKAKKGLRLDWVENFVRVIPDDLLAKKSDADARGVFDNYVVLHYDPEAKSWSETEAQKASRRDPILFGLIKGRRRLYYVGDWVDEFCDLTLDQIADTLGRNPAGELNPKEF